MHLLKIVLVFLCTALSISCTSNESIETKLYIGSDLNFSESLESWELLKKENGNSYKYSAEAISWTNSGIKTEITVIEGEVISRSYETYQYTEGVKTIGLSSYFEQGDDLGTHEIGHAAVSIDELYNSCITKYLNVNSGTNSIYFEVNEAGLLTTCGYVPENCVDDCFFGIKIGDFEWIEL